jgi:soluble lytic murein transglycosylase-like protein
LGINAAPGALLFLLVAFAAPALAAESETAALTSGFDDGGSVALPKILSLEDAETYRTIFGLQEAGQWLAADREIAKLENDILRGHVLAQRYLHPTMYRSKYSELRDWLALYADHPDAPRIHRLALRRKPAAAAAPQAPRGGIFGGWMPEDASFPIYQPQKRLDKAQQGRVRQLQSSIRARLRRGWPTGASELLGLAAVKTLFDQVQIDRARADIAASFFYYGKDVEALAMASAAVEKSSVFVPTAHWIGGLAAWRTGQRESATVHFEALALAKGVTDWYRAAGAYWAARANLVARNPENVNRWLLIAAVHPRTLYGLLARKSLGFPVVFEWRDPPLTESDLDLLVALPRGARALALIQSGERDRANAELRRVHPAGPDEARALAAIAVQARLPLLALKIGASLEAVSGERFDSAVYPIPAWEPADGFKVDRALIYAFIRQESRFSTRATSRVGARGLMQLMPATASFIAGDRSLRSSARHRLYEPSFNMMLGQKYIEHLLVHKEVEGDLARLVAAYNGGPGNLGKWRRQTRFADDPLLFIESLPARETRDFIERVLTNLWIYRHQLGQGTPSLDAIAAGEWPSYIALDGTTSAVASNVGN